MNKVVIKPSREEVRESAYRVQRIKNRYGTGYMDEVKSVLAPRRKGGWVLKCTWSWLNWTFGPVFVLPKHHPDDPLPQARGAVLHIGPLLIGLMRAPKAKVAS
jgi:hypothetical protein